MESVEKRKFVEAELFEFIESLTRSVTRSSNLKVTEQVALYLENIWLLSLLRGFMDNTAFSFTELVLIHAEMPPLLPISHEPPTSR